jgi:phage tail tube protein FII
MNEFRSKEDMNKKNGVEDIGGEVCMTSYIQKCIQGYEEMTSSVANLERVVLYSYKHNKTEQKNMTACLEVSFMFSNSS